MTPTTLAAAIEAGIVCPVCKGEGRVERTGFRGVNVTRDCTTCKSRGRIEVDIDRLTFIVALREVAAAREMGDADEAWAYEPSAVNVAKRAAARDRLIEARARLDARMEKQA